jgi:hypothetical protein
VAENRSEKRSNGGVKITVETWALLYEAFLEDDTNISRAARLAKVSAPTARKALRKGFDYLEKPPIAILIAERRREVRGALEEEAEKRIVAKQADHAETELERQYRDAEKARRDAIKSRRQEAEIARGERANVMALIGTTGVILGGAMKSARDIERALREGIDPNVLVKDPTTGRMVPRKLTIVERVRLLESVGRLVRIAGETAKDVVHVERLLLGEPTDIVGVRRLEELTEDDAIARLRRAGEAASRMEDRRQRRGAFKLVQGGSGS